jgi:amino-acid N-acetyltransferase
MIRPATIHDVPRIQEIIKLARGVRRMLFKSYAQLYEDLARLRVFETDATPDAPKHIAGCVALTIIWADLTEVRSLAVDQSQKARQRNWLAARALDGGGSPAAGDSQADVAHLTSSGFSRSWGSRWSTRTRCR